VASPTERAGKVCLLLQFDGPLSKSDAEKWLPPGSQVVTPEDIQAGWRVLTPEQAETLSKALKFYADGGWRLKESADGNERAWHDPDPAFEALALLAGVPEDIQAGWRPLPPEQAAWCRATINRLSRYGLSEEDAAAVELALEYLAEVPGKDSDRLSALVIYRRGCARRG